MRSVTCSSCGFVSWAIGNDCKQCGKPLPPDQPFHRPSPPPSYDYGAAPDYFSPTAKKRAGHAVASLVLGIIGFFSFGLLLIGSIVGTSLGIVALKKERSEPAKYGGRGMAIAGIVMNVAALVMIVPIGIIAAIAIPNVLASVRAANESSAISAIRTIAAAEDTYQSTDGDGEYAGFEKLVASGLIDPRLSRGVRNGYRFTLVNNGSEFEVSATPLNESAGKRSFFYSSTDETIRARLDGQPATLNDPPLNLYDDAQSRRLSQQPRAGVPAYAPAN